MFFIALFLLLVFWLIWTETVKRGSLRNNVYNTKQESNSSRIIRGSIAAEDGTLLAVTNVDGEGNETRTYPYGNVFSHVIGYSSNGRSGLESTSNYDLLESHSSLLSQLQLSEDDSKVQGDTVVVTLDPKLQQAAYNALGSYKGAVVVMEPDTGKIRAMVSKPDFDPNTLSAEWENMVSDESSSALLNRVTQGLYPPGSIFKIVTSTAYIRENPDSWQNFSWNCTGTITEGVDSVHCYQNEQHGQETLADAFAHSCNTAYASIGLTIAPDDFRKCAEDFLFNGSLPTNLPYAESVFSLSSDSSAGEKMTTAIGQGNTLVTPLHMALITSAVANGGTMMRPYLVDHIETYDGDMVSENKPSIYRKVLTPEEAQTLNTFMQGTVNYGTGYALAGNGYTAGGKTGSAEYEKDGTTGTHSWFVGFCNAEDPDLVVAVIAEDGGTGSSTAVPIAKQIFDTYYYG